MLEEWIAVFIESCRFLDLRKIYNLMVIADVTSQLAWYFTIIIFQHSTIC